MRILNLSLAMILGAALVTCSSGSEDPLAEKCKSGCDISNSHPCYDDGKGEAECVKVCRTLVGSVDKNPAYMSGCAECLAGQFTYPVDTSKSGCSETSGGVDCCYPGYVLQPVLNEPSSKGWTACEAKCIEPDGGAGY